MLVKLACDFFPIQWQWIVTHFQASKIMQNIIHVTVIQLWWETNWNLSRNRETSIVFSLTGSSVLFTEKKVLHYFLDTKPLLSAKEITTNNTFRRLVVWMDYFLYLSHPFWAWKWVSILCYPLLWGSYFYKTFTFCGRNKVMVWNTMRMSKGFLGELSL